MNSIKMLPIRIYLGMCGFFSRLKDDEEGLSGVVVSVLLILVSVLAVALIWGFLSGWLQTLWTKIETGGNAIS